jgi:hypothetical protein
MSDDFGPINPVVSPFLERIVRDERLSGDQPRKSKYIRTTLAKKNQDSPSSDDTQETDDSASSPHIDLRI